MKKQVLLLIVAVLFTVGFITYVRRRESELINIEAGVLRESLPMREFEKSSATKIEAWSGKSIDLLRKTKRLQIACKECFVTLCDDSKTIRFFTVHTSELSQQQLDELHSDFCDVFEAYEQIPQFANWMSGDHKQLLSMNKFDESRVYNFSVHRTYDTKFPWFASIEVAWSCRSVEIDGSSKD